MRNLRIPQVFTLIQFMRNIRIPQVFTLIRKLYVWAVFSSEYIKKKNHR